MSELASLRGFLVIRNPAGTIVSPNTRSIRFFNSTVVLNASGEVEVTPLGGGGGAPAAPVNSVQFNNGGVFGGDADFTFLTGGNVLKLGRNTDTYAAGSSHILQLGDKTGFPGPVTAYSNSKRIIDFLTFQGTTVTGSNDLIIFPTAGTSSITDAQSSVILGMTTSSILGNTAGSVFNLVTSTIDGSREAIVFSNGSTITPFGPPGSASVSFGIYFLRTTTTTGGLSGSLMSIENSTLWSVLNCLMVGKTFITTNLTQTQQSLVVGDDINICTNVGNRNNSAIVGLGLRASYAGPSFALWNCYLFGQYNDDTKTDRKFVVANGASAVARLDAMYVNTANELGIDGGLRIRETGANPRMGTAVLAGGTAVVATTAVAANSRIFISRKTQGAGPGFLSYTVAAGVSFTVTSSNGADTGAFDWMIIQPD